MHCSHLVSCRAAALQVVDELSSNISVIEKLQRFQYKDKNSKDWGLNVRQRAKELTSLVTDPERIKRERQKVPDFLSPPLPAVLPSPLEVSLNGDIQ